MIPRSTDGKVRALSLSYGKDSLACLGACEELQLPLDRIIHAEVWATDTIQADLPPVVEFKAKADAIIRERWGLEVEHFRAEETYNSEFYKDISDKSFEIRKAIGLYNKYQTPLNRYTGFPCLKRPWCNGKLKMKAIKIAKKSTKGCISYVGIAEDEPIRLARLDGVNSISPLHLIKWTEKDAMDWCIRNNLRSPTYDTSNRGGCWFCHNQGINELRYLRKTYPELWEILLQWDKDSPITFKPDGHTVHDYDERFRWEDEGFLPKGKRFLWSDLEEPQINFDMMLRDTK